MNDNLLTLKNVTKVLQAMKKSFPYIAVFQILLPVLDPEQSCVFLKFKRKKKLLQYFLGYEVRFEAVWFGPPLYSGSFLLMFSIWLNLTLDKV